MPANTSMPLNENEPYAAYWAMWSRESAKDVPIATTIDQLFKGYLFYPEPEWRKFGYRPPDKFPLIGAWRDVDGKVFIFLLDSKPKRQANEPRQLLLYATGGKGEVDFIEQRIILLKTLLVKVEKKELRGRQAESRLEVEKHTQSIERLMKLIGLFTIFINAFALYLRKLSPPSFPSDSFRYGYELVLITVHFLALLLMLLIIIICLFYAFRYGWLLLRRMWS